MAGSKTLPTRKFGKAIGEAFRARIADVLAAQNVAELPLWFLDGAARGCFNLPVAEGCYLVFKSNHASDRESDVETPINWDRVTRVQLLEVKFNG